MNTEDPMFRAASLAMRHISCASAVKDLWKRCKENAKRRNLEEHKGWDRLQELEDAYAMFVFSLSGDAIKKLEANRSIVISSEKRNEIIAEFASETLIIMTSAPAIAEIAEASKDIILSRHKGESNG